MSFLRLKKDRAKLHLTIKHVILILNQNQSIATAQVYDWISYIKYKTHPSLDTFTKGMHAIFILF